MTPKLSAARRAHTRKLTGGMLFSLGTAVFSGVVGLVVSSAVDATAYHWTPILILTVAGAALSGSGSWLIASTRTNAAVVVIARDDGGDATTYDSAITNFLRFSETRFTQQAACGDVVRTSADLTSLRTSAVSVINAITQATSSSSRVGLYFHGTHHVGFHLGRWLNIQGRRFDLYQTGKDGYYLAQRLSQDSPHVRTGGLDIEVFLSDNGAFEPPVQVDIHQLKTVLKDRTGTMALAINLQGPVNGETMATPVKQSALREGVDALVIMGLTQQLPIMPTPTTWVPEERDAIEAMTAAIAAVADAMPATVGLLYLRGPVVAAVALGRFLHATRWIPMRHQKLDSTYERFPYPG